MNKFLLVTLIYLGTTSAFASDCSINYVADDQLTNIIKKTVSNLRITKIMPNIK
jgi:hypothetical protein